MGFLNVEWDEVAMCSAPTHMRLHAHAQTQRVQRFFSLHVQLRLLILIFQMGLQIKWEENKYSSPGKQK